MIIATLPHLRALVVMIILVVVMASPGTRACTTAVISGRVTVDGRPLLWKNRDAWQRQNEMLSDTSGRFAFIGVANAEATRRIRMGCNTAGLCIENSVSADLDDSDSDSSGMTNGELIREALQSCATAADFQALLDRTNRSGRTTRGNFGVIDASGAAMIFEVGPDRYAVFDANDPETAPNGILIRANFSETGLSQRDDPNVTAASAYSSRRYQRAMELTDQQTSDSRLDVRFLLQQVARDINGCAASCFSSHPTADETVASSVSNSRMLNRGNTVSAVVFRGVLPGEPATNTIMWTILGEPLFSIAVPAWPTQGGVAEVTNGPGSSELCQQAIRLRRRHYDPVSANLLTERLRNTTERIREIENAFIDEVQGWPSTDRKRMTPEQQFELHESIALRATKALQALATSLPIEEAKVDIEKGVRAVDFSFDDPDGTRLAASNNAAGVFAFDGGISNSQTIDGVFRIGRNKLEPINRYVSIEPRIRVRGSNRVRRGFLVADIRGWNLRGKTLGEEVRIGFTSQGRSHYHAAAIRLVRTENDMVTLSGVAFGDGSTSIESTKSFPAKLDRPIEVVIELDKARGNPDEGETGGEYRVFFRHRGEQHFQSLGAPGKVRRNRNGNEIHLRTAGRFAAQEERFDIDRLYYTVHPPTGLAAWLTESNP